MSDFLHNLIARSYSLKPVAQPRLASRFEPVSSNSWSSQYQTLSTEQEAPGEASADAKAQANAAQLASLRGTQRATGELNLTLDSSPQAEQFSPRPRQSEGQEPLAGPAQKAANSSTRNPARAGHESFEGQHEPLASELASQPSLTNVDALQGAAVNLAGQSERQASALQNSLRAAGAEGRNAERKGGATEHDQASDAGSAAHLSAERQEGAESARRTVAPAKVSAPSASISANVSAQTIPGRENFAALAGESLAGDGMESSSPIIRVTIGRIDVRALMTDSKSTQPPAAPARQTHTPLSLEEYLKQRNGGAR